MEIDDSGSREGEKGQDSDEGSTYSPSKINMDIEDGSEPGSPASPVSSPACSPVTSPTYSPPASPRTLPPGSPVSGPASPRTSPGSPATSPPASPRTSPLASPSSPPGSPNSPPASPATSPLASPVNSPPASPANSSVISPENSPPASPANSSGASQGNSPPASPANSSRENSPPASPANSSRENSPPASPANSSQENSPPASPANSSPQRSRESSLPVSPVNSPPTSRPASPDGSDHHSEEEVHVSEPEESGQSEGEQGNDKENSRADEKMNSDGEEQSESKEVIEDSDKEGSVPEINIDSGDEENDQESVAKCSGVIHRSDSENESEKAVRSDDEKAKENEHQSDDEKPADSDEDERKPRKSNRKNRISDSEDDADEAPKSPVPASDTEEKMDLSVEDNNQSVPRKRRKNKLPKPYLKGLVDVLRRNNNKEENSDSDESEVGELIADIFGESDEDEEFEGFGDEDLKSAKQNKEKKVKISKAISDSEEEAEKYTADNEEKEIEVAGDEEDDEPPAPIETDSPIQKKQKATHVASDDSDDEGVQHCREGFVSDFDLMMQKKKEENQRKRKRKDVDIINDSDDLIADLIQNMKHASEEDKELNRQKKTATKKLKILPVALSQLKKQDLKEAFLDQGILTVIADWLSPLPDRSLPHLAIREGMIRMLAEFPPIDQSLLKSSGVGRAIMYLFKHPKEAKENKEKIGRIITEWSRPIFNVTTNFHSLSKEEREARDFDHIPRKKRTKELAQEEDTVAAKKKDIDKALTDAETSLRPGDKGWIGRARVPVPSTKDYVVRPKWNVDVDIGRGSGKKPMNRFEKRMKSLQDKKRLNKVQRAVTISIEGRKMAI